MEYVETTKEEIEEAKECCKTLNCGDCPLKESDYCTEQIESRLRRKETVMDKHDVIRIVSIFLPLIVFILLYIAYGGIPYKGILLR